MKVSVIVRSHSKYGCFVNPIIPWDPPFTAARAARTRNLWARRDPALTGRASSRICDGGLSQCATQF